MTILYFTCNSDSGCDQTNIKLSKLNDANLRMSYYGAIPWYQCIKVTIKMHTNKGKSYACT